MRFLFFSIMTVFISVSFAGTKSQDLPSALSKYVSQTKQYKNIGQLIDAVKMKMPVSDSVFFEKSFGVYKNTKIPLVTASGDMLRVESERTVYSIQFLLEPKRQVIFNGKAFGYQSPASLYGAIVIEMELMTKVKSDFSSLFFPNSQAVAPVIYAVAAVIAAAGAVAYEYTCVTEECIEEEKTKQEMGVLVTNPKYVSQVKSCHEAMMVSARTDGKYWLIMGDCLERFKDVIGYEDCMSFNHNLNGEATALVSWFCLTRIKERPQTLNACKAAAARICETACQGQAYALQVCSTLGSSSEADYISVIKKYDPLFADRQYLKLGKFPILPLKGMSTENNTVNQPVQ